MTMPHLMNCQHNPDGWCLDCVKEMYDEHELEIAGLWDIINHYKEICAKVLELTNERD